MAVSSAGSPRTTHFRARGGGWRMGWPGAPSRRLLTQGAIGCFPAGRCPSSLHRVTTCESEHLLSESSASLSSRPATPLSFTARRQVFEQMVPFYREASLAQKALLQDQSRGRSTSDGAVIPIDISCRELHQRPHPFRACS